MDRRSRTAKTLPPSSAAVSWSRLRASAIATLGDCLGTAVRDRAAAVPVYRGAAVTATPTVPRAQRRDHLPLGVEDDVVDWMKSPPRLLHRLRRSRALNCPHRVHRTPDTTRHQQPGTRCRRVLVAGGAVTPDKPLPQPTTRRPARAFDRMHRRSAGWPAVITPCRSARCLPSPPPRSGRRLRRNRRSGRCRGRR